MRLELASAGHEVHFVAINKIDARPMAAELTSECRFPVLQDTDGAKVWETLLQGDKDDLFIYDSDGALVNYLPTPGDVDTNLSTAEGYANLKAAILAAE